MNPHVDFFFTKAQTWRAEYAALRHIILTCELGEELKWGKPCYCLADQNVVLIHGFKAYCALLFFKGAIMKDPQGLLVQQTEHVQGPRQLRFASLAEIEAQSAYITSYVHEAVALEKAGAKVVLKKELGTFPDELTLALQNSPDLKAAFEALTPGRQRGYLLHFNSAKQPTTRTARVEKHAPRILAGLGLDD
jgi:uncharacterized protein YdeI (YjbR/CyaY-like superfamily)